MKNKKKTIRNLIIFILLIVLTFYIILKDQNVSELRDIVIGAKKQYILIAIICMFLYLTFEAINIGRTLKALNEKSNFFSNLKYAFIGFFFSSITPAASGGQPMQIYYMHKDNVSVANSTLTLLINLTSFQIVTISFALFSVCINHSILNKTLVWLFILGITLNSMALILLLIGVFSKRLSQGLINFAVKVLQFFKFKNIENVREKMDNEVSKYQESAKYIKANRLVMLKTLFTTLIQIIIYYSIPYWVYLSFGLSGNSVFQIITTQAVLYATVSGIPLPGAVGVSEGGFIEIFKSIFSQSIISGAMLLNRGVSFYLFVVISSIVAIVNMFKAKKIDIENEI